MSRSKQLQRICFSTSHATAIVSLLACLQKLFTATLNGRSYSGRQNGVLVLQPFVLSLFQSVIFNSVFDTLMLSVETKAFFSDPRAWPLFCLTGKCKVGSKEAQKNKSSRLREKKCKTTENNMKSTFLQQTWDENVY